MLKDNQISEQGTFKELLQKKGPFQEFLLQYLASDSEELDDLEGRCLFLNIIIKSVLLPPVVVIRILFPLYMSMKLSMLQLTHLYFTVLSDFLR